MSTAESHSYTKAHDKPQAMNRQIKAKYGSQGISLVVTKRLSRPAAEAQAQNEISC